MIKYDDYKVYKIYSQDMNAAFAPGRRILAKQIGADNVNDYIALGFIDDDGVKIFNKRISYKEEADLFFDVLTGINKEYEIKESRTCLICNRKLTTPQSIEMGIGPDCWRRNGL